MPKLEKFHKIEKRKRKFGEKHGTGSQMSTKDDNRSIKTPGSERTGTGKGPRRKPSLMNHSNSNSGSAFDLNDRNSGSPQQGNSNRQCLSFPLSILPSETLTNESSNVPSDSPCISMH